MILHSDGRIEGTPAEIAEYTLLISKVVGSHKEITRVERETLKERLRRTTGLPPAVTQKYPGGGTIYIKERDPLKPTTATFYDGEYIERMKSFGNQ